MDSFEAILLENTIKPITELSFHKIKHEFKSIPSDINKLKYLEVLNLGDITVDETSIVRLSFLKNLRELIIQNYQSHAFPIILIQCTKLKSLSLSHSQITSLPESLNLWHGLSYLNISYNKLLSEVNGMPPNLTYLHIGDTGLRTIPRNIYELENLRKLVANNLDFTKIPKEIFKIVSLRRLFLSDNKIKSISKEIIKLKELVELVLINNEFVTFPSNVTVLNKLYNLNLRDNYISSLPDDATNLLSLKIIDLSDNSLTEFPVPLLKLSLQSISLSNASYKRRIIKNRIKVIPEDIINNKSLHVLEIAGNPIENVPDEIVEGGLDAIKNFFQSKLEADNEDFLFEAKMVVVGRGNVGKSVLTKKLTNPNYELGKNDSTLGINVLKNPFYTKVTIGSSNIDFKLNIWDFGGQENYDSIQQLFITKK